MESFETASAEVLQDYLVLSSELMMQSGLRKDFPELLFRALALHRSKTLLLVRYVGSSNMGQHRLLRSSSFGSALMF